MAGAASLEVRFCAHAGAATFRARTSIGCAEAVDGAGALDEDVKMSSGCEVAPVAEADATGFFEGVDDAEAVFCVEGGGGEGVCGMVRRPAGFASSLGG